jgi:hypothetical protein
MAELTRDLVERVVGELSKRFPADETNVWERARPIREQCLSALIVNAAALLRVLLDRAETAEQERDEARRIAGDCHAEAAARRDIAPLPWEDVR